MSGQRNRSWVVFVALLLVSEILADEVAEPAAEGVPSALGLPGPGLELPVDVDGDGVSTEGERFLFNWWLANGGGLAEALAAGRAADGILDVSELFRVLQRPGPLVAAEDRGARSVSVEHPEAFATDRLPPAVEPDGDCQHVRMNGGDESEPAGKYWVFSSRATNLRAHYPEVPNNEDEISRIYRWDAIEDELVLASRDSSGFAAEDDCFRPSISDDGLVVVFESWARLTPEDPDDGFTGADIFVRDLRGASDETRLVSSKDDGAGGTTSSEGLSTYAAVSGDGWHVAFTSADPALDPAHPFTTQTTFVYRTSTDGLASADLVSLSNGHEAGGPMTTADTGDPLVQAVGRIVSHDGTRIVFQGVPVDPNWDSGAGPGLTNAYMRDLTWPGAGEKCTELTDVPEGPLRNPTISSEQALAGPGGHRVAFCVQSTVSGFEEIWWADYDRSDPDPERWDFGPPSYLENPPLADFTHPVLTRQGRHLVFATAHSGLVPAATNGKRQVFAKDTEAAPSDGFVLLSVSAAGVASATDCKAPDAVRDLAGSGIHAGFETEDEEVAPGQFLHSGLVATNGEEGFSEVYRRFEPLLVPFRRGDASPNGGVDLADATFIFNYLFQGGSAPECFDAADADDSGNVDISDGIYILAYKFQGGPPPPPPGPASCGPEPTPDELRCAGYSPSCN